MARLPTSGVRISTPFQDGSSPRVLDKADLRDALAELCPQMVFASSDIKIFYSDLSLILGLWDAEQDRLDSSQLGRAISGIRTDLEAIAKTLSAQQNGLHQRLDLEIVTQLTTM